MEDKLRTVVVYDAAENIEDEANGIGAYFFGSLESIKDVREMTKREKIYKLTITIEELTDF